MFSFFFFNDTATTEIYTLSLHDALPIYGGAARARGGRLPRDAPDGGDGGGRPGGRGGGGDRKSTRLNSSHGYISYAVFCLEKKNEPVAVPPAVRMGFGEHDHANPDCVDI